MNIYKVLNEITLYIDENLEYEIDYGVLAKKMGVNEYTMRRIFSLLTNITLAEYIRKRRLSNAGYDLYNGNLKVIDVAIKYGYDNATSFSRSFTAFHGIKPSEVRKNPEKLKLYTKLHFNEQYECNKNINYTIIEKDELTLYGKYKLTSNDEIEGIAPKFYEEMAIKYGDAPYASIEYEDSCRMNVKAYWVLYYDKKEDMEKFIIPKSRWIQLRVNSQEPEDIQENSRVFYEEFLPNSKYNFRDLPELEYYHDDVTDFLIPIED